MSYHYAYEHINLKLEKIYNSTKIAPEKIPSKLIAINLHKSSLYPCFYPPNNPSRTPPVHTHLPYWPFHWKYQIFKENELSAQSSYRSYKKQQILIKINYYYLKFLIHGKSSFSRPSRFLSLFFHHGRCLAVRLGTLFMLLKKSFLLGLKQQERTSNLHRTSKLISEFVNWQTEKELNLVWWYTYTLISLEIRIVKLGVSFIREVLPSRWGDKDCFGLVVLVCNFVVWFIFLDWVIRVEEKFHCGSGLLRL